MATLHIRDFPEDLQRRVRVAAARNDETNKSLIIRAIERELDRLDKQAR